MYDLRWSMWDNRTGCITQSEMTNRLLGECLSNHSNRSKLKIEKIPIFRLEVLKTPAVCYRDMPNTQKHWRSWKCKGGRRWNRPMRAKESRFNGLTPLCNHMDTARTLLNEDSFQLKTKSCDSKTKIASEAFIMGWIVPL